MAIFIERETDPTSTATHSVLSRLKNTPQSSAVTLRLASKRVDGGGFFRESLAIETMVAVIGAGNRIELRLHHRDEGAAGIAEHISRFDKQPANRIALLLADAVVDVDGKSVNADVLRQARHVCADEAHEIDHVRARTGVSGVDLVGLYGDASPLQYPGVVYDLPRQGKVDRTRVRGLVDVALNKSGGASRASRYVIATEVLEDLLTDLVYETFQNTDKHALTDWEGTPIERGARGVSIRRFSVLREKLNGGELLKNAPDVLNVATDDWKRLVGETSLDFAEITVFDCGPGFASRFSGRDANLLSFQEEQSLVVQCFEESSTSAPEEGRGLGLSGILELLDARSGVLRLRTGRVSLYGQFNRRSTKRKLINRLFPEQGRGLNLPLAGSVLTMIVPLPEKGKIVPRLGEGK